MTVSLLAPLASSSTINFLQSFDSAIVNLDGTLFVSNPRA